VPAKFVVKKGTTGKFRFNLLSTNGNVIATSQTYETKRACLAGIESVRKNAPNATIDDQTKPQWRRAPRAAHRTGELDGRPSSSLPTGIRPFGPLGPSRPTHLGTSKTRVACRISPRGAG